MPSTDRQCGGFGHDEHVCSGFLPMSAPQRVREALNRHPHFCGRVDLFKLEWAEDVLIVKGTVPTYYLKQLLHNLLKKVDGVRIDNRVDVVWQDSYGQGSHN
jgi:hypothetical protein